MTSSTPRRRVTIAAAAVAAVLTTLSLAGCTFGPNEQPEAAQQRIDFPNVYAQEIAWGECDESFGMPEPFAQMLADRGAPVESFQCAMIDVPLDWNDPSRDETVKLAISHLPSPSGDAKEALFSNPGGPGQSGLSHAFTLTASEGFTDVYAAYDLIGIDPRGVGLSTPVACESVSSIRSVNLATCADANPIAHSMGTSQAARDMELVRALIDAERFNYLGYSYGTVLGATYSTLFPEQVGRMLLDGAIDSGWSSLTGNFDQAMAIVGALSQLLSDCGTLYEQTSCPIADPDALNTVKNQLDDAPLVASDGTPVPGEMFLHYLISGLYQADGGREIVLDVSSRALAGEQMAIDFLAEQMAGGGAKVNLSGTFVKCHSFPADPDIPGFLAHIEDAEIPALLNGPGVNDAVLREHVDLSCFALAESGDDITDSFTGPAGDPVLVIGITGDHATPYARSESLVRQLGNAHLLTLQGNGHGASFQGRSTCADDAATAYLLTGALPPDDLICTDD
ncbi:pimeloyl-ACP methyl ester carboxylesterase [Microbacterium keratanolyticum]|uniref:Proteinase n=1 Tax=Microbacterium keratanolyticum TaxID=67574 RepID=A0A9W6HUA2_9MICO|nr:alpha/beta hydrolase [Microbacterium keratanolyticum]MBM7468098.1 pimeloyl-ACP methyl ester carboxylesterase [Microbacterium keratanolyticum]GLK03088.1 proteinase [Microbacterium keratanolyticum]